MAVGGIAELLFGVPAEQRSLEKIAKPLTAIQAERMRERAERRRDYDRDGLRRFRPGPGLAYGSPAMLGTAGDDRRAIAMSDEALDREIEVIATVVTSRGPIGRDDLARAVKARYWGPGRFRDALREAVREGRAKETAHHAYGPPDG
jgi:hypothetical protein